MIERKQDGGSGEIRIVDIVAIIVSRWRTILGMTVATVAFAALVLLVLPKTFTARAVLVPAPEKSSAGTGLLVGQLPAGVAGLIGGSRRDESLIHVVLNSRSLTDSIVSRVGREDVSEGRIREILADNTEVRSGKHGEIEITVTAEDPRLAARIASEFHDAINEIAAEITQAISLRRQRFVEGQLAVARDMLLASEQEALDFQRTQDAPEVQEQAKLTIEAAAMLQREIMQQEVRVGQLRRTATPSNPELRAAEAELAALRTQLRRLMSGSGGAGQIFLSLEESPELKIAAGRLLREFTKNERIYASLLASLTEAQLEAQNDLPVVTVVDPAVVPEGPSGPATRVILSLAAVLGLVAGTLAALAAEWMRALPNDPANEPLLAAWDRMKTDLRRYTPHRRNGASRVVRK